MHPTTSIRLILCKGALSQLLPAPDWGAQETHSFALTCAAVLRQMLRERYRTEHVEVDVRPELLGRMRLAMDGGGLDAEAEREQIWSLAQQASKRARV